MGGNGPIMEIITKYRSKKQRKVDEDARLIAKVIRKAANVSKWNEKARKERNKGG